MKEIKTLKDMLIRMRDLSDLMIELGYAAVLQDDIMLAQDVTKIKKEIADLTFQMRISTIYAAKGIDKDEIVQLASILQLGVAVKEISDGMDDMVEIVARGIHPIIAAAYRKDLIIKRITVEKGSEIDGQPLEKAKLPEKTGFVIRAILRKGDWIFEPTSKTVLKSDDIIYAKGKDVAIRKMLDYAKKKEKEEKKTKSSK